MHIKYINLPTFGYQSQDSGTKFACLWLLYLCFLVDYENLSLDASDLKMKKYSMSSLLLQKLMQPVFNKLIEFIRNCKGDYTYLSCALNSIRVIGAHDKEYLTPHKELFEELGEKHPNLKDMCKMLVDIIEGRR